jgi:hypothetical protein
MQSGALGFRREGGFQRIQHGVEARWLMAGWNRFCRRPKGIHARKNKGKNSLDG